MQLKSHCLVSHHRRSWTHARHGRPWRKATTVAQRGANATCLIFRLPSYYRSKMDECLRWNAQRRQPSSHIQPAVMSDKFVPTRCRWNVMIMKPTGCQPTLKIWTTETRSSWNQERWVEGIFLWEQSLFDAVSGDSGVLSRQGTMNSHMKDTQFFMGMAGGAAGDLLVDLVRRRW